MKKTTQAASNNPAPRYKELKYCEGAEKELKKLPEDVAAAFLHCLEMVRYGLKPTLDIDHLTAAGSGVIELIINGSPAFRCVYYNKKPDALWVVLAATKTTNGQDLTLIRKARLRVGRIK